MWIKCCDVVRGQGLFSLIVYASSVCAWNEDIVSNLNSVYSDFLEQVNRVTQTTPWPIGILIIIILY